MFEIAKGIFIGRDHQAIQGNCQDAYSIVETPDFIIALITDGCSRIEDKPTHSEVGAWIGARLQVCTFAEHIERSLKRGKPFLGHQLFWDRVRADVLAKIRVLAIQMGDSLPEVVTNFFLFTTVGVIITKSESAFFSLGDGNIFINEEHIQIGPFSENMPPYLAYGLLETSIDPFLLSYQIQRVLQTHLLDTFLLGSDGVEYLLNSEDLALPGKTELVGPVSQFWTQDRYFSNPDAINRRLRLINENKQRVNWESQRIEREHGHLTDDIVIIAGRRVL